MDNQENEERLEELQQSEENQDLVQEPAEEWEQNSPLDLAAEEEESSTDGEVGTPAVEPEAVEEQEEEIPAEVQEDQIPVDEETEVPDDIVEAAEEPVSLEETPAEPGIETPEVEVIVEEQEEEIVIPTPEQVTDQQVSDPYKSVEVQVEPVVDDDRAWYVIHCYSGNEDKVRHNILQRIESMSMDDLIFDVIVPTEDEVNIKNGERQTVEKKVFPGYILVNMILTEESWYMVRNTPGVTGFVGMGNDPTPLQPEEVARILKRMESESPRINVTFRQGERVRIVDGPFEDFYGKVAEIDMERATVRVMVNFFGRETPVELDFLQVEEA